MKLSVTRKFSNRSKNDRRSIRRSESVRDFESDRAYVFTVLKDKFHQKPMRKVKRISMIDKILHTSTGHRTPRYLTEGHNLKFVRDLENEPSPFLVPDIPVIGQNVVKKIIEKEMTAVKKIYKKHYMVPTYRSRNSSDILERLYIPRDEAEIKSIVDIIPQYYSMLKGRPTSLTLNKKTYIDTINNTFKFNILEANFDELNTFYNVQNILDFKCMSTLFEFYDKADSLLDGFLMSEEKYMIDMMETFSIVMNMKMQQNDELLKVKLKTSESQDQVEHAFSLLSMRVDFKNMLNKLSPPSWRKEYEEKMNRSWSPYHVHAYVEISDIYNEYLDTFDVPNQYFVNLLTRAKNLISKMGPHAMYFKSMHELEDVIQNLEEQVVESIASLCNAVHDRQLFKSKAEAMKKYHNRQKMALQDSITMLKKGTKFNLDRADNIKMRLHRKVDTWFKEVIVGEETMMVNSLIMCMYDEIVGNRTSMIAYHTMIDRLEEKLIHTWAEIQSIGKDNMKKMTESMRLKEQKAVELALKVKKKDDMLKILVKQMERSFAPVRKDAGKKPKHRTRPPPLDAAKETVNKKKSKLKSLHSLVNNLEEESEDCKIVYNIERRKPDENSDSDKVP